MELLLTTSQRHKSIKTTNIELFYEAKQYKNCYTLRNNEKLKYKMDKKNSTTFVGKQIEVITVIQFIIQFILFTC